MEADVSLISQGRNVVASERPGQACFRQSTQSIIRFEAEEGLADFLALQIPRGGALNPRRIGAGS